MKRYSPLLLILALIGSLAVSQTALAASSAAPSAPTSLLQSAAAEPEEEAEGEFEEEFEVLGELEFEACEATAGDLGFAEFEEAEEEEFEAEVEECEEEAKKGKGKGTAFVTAPAECLVHRAESTITTLPGSDRVRLTVHYTNYSPTAVAIGLRLKDHEGSLGLERTTKHLGRGGVLNLTTKLGEAEMERVEEAREFDVELRAADTPGYCSAMLEQHLHSKQAAGKAKAHGSRVYSAPHAD